MRQVLLAIAFVLSASTVLGQTFTEKRERMVEEQIARRGITDSAVLRAMATVPRHRFVSESYIDYAYADRPLPIGYGQTISQPYIVALMTQLLELEPGDRVLEIGTGSGYQAAVLAEILDEVYTIEIIPELADRVAGLFRTLAYDSIRVKQSDGYYGWEEHAPYDAIVVTAATEHIPPPLVQQLKDGGRMIIPVGSPFFTQTLMLVRKTGGKVTTNSLIPVRFVPFTRSDGDP